jgi:hypothetical protein
MATRVAAYPYVPELGEVDADLICVVSEYLERITKKLPADVRVEVLVRRGEPGHELIGLARDGDTDLVVMTTHGRGGVRRFLLGSIADRLVRCGASVLLVPPNAETGRATPDRAVAAPTLALPAARADAAGSERPCR